MAADVAVDTEEYLAAVAFGHFVQLEAQVPVPLDIEVLAYSVEKMVAPQGRVHTVEALQLGAVVDVVVEEAEVDAAAVKAVDVVVVVVDTEDN